MPCFFIVDLSQLSTVKTIRSLLLAGLLHRYDPLYEKPLRTANNAACVRSATSSFERMFET